MGGAASVNGKGKEPKRKNSLGVWTEEEKKEIEEGEAIMKKASVFIANHFFYGVPVSLSRQSHDPLAPLWIRADAEKALQRGTEMEEIEQEWKMIRSVPTTVMVTPKGKVVVVFERSKVKYDLTIDGITNAIERDADVQSIPLPPFLGGQSQTQLVLYWELADPPGLAQYIEVQFRRCRPLPEPGSVPLEPYPWQALVSKTWDLLNFDSFVFEGLRPGTYFQFRLRYRNHKGWTEFSDPSDRYRTLPGIPSKPRQPISSAILPHAAHLAWRAPSANGAVIERYVLEGRAVGEKEFIELFSGMMLSHVVFNLHPEFAYNFRIKAINAVGESEYSDIYSLQTPAKFHSPLRSGDWREDVAGNADNPDEEGDEDNAPLSASGYANAQRCADAWRPHYDHKTGQMFYFNVLTGARQLQIPVAIVQERMMLARRQQQQQAPSEDTSEDSVTIKDDRDLLIEKVAAFRLKRFRFMRELRRQRQETSCHSPVRPPMPSASDDPGDGEGSAVTSEEDRLAAELQLLAPVPTSSTSSVFNLDVQRETMLVETFRVVSSFRTGGVGGELRKRLRVTFQQEAGIDVGGLTKEFYLILSKQMMRYASEKYRKWMRSTESGRLFFNEVTSQMLSFSVIPHDVEEASSDIEAISPTCLTALSKVNGKSFVHFMGRIIGKALFDQQMVDAPLCGALLSHMTRPSASTAGSVGFGDNFLSDEDMKDLDPQLHQSLSWMKDNDITGVLDNTFTVIGPGGNEVILCKDGDKKEVTEENKAEYIKLMVQWKAMFSVSTLLTQFLEGFWELVPLSLLIEHEIQAQDLDMMLNGKASIDVEEIRAYTIFQGDKDFNDNHPQVIMLWQVVREFEDSLQRGFLKFVTGTSRVPLDGYDPPFNLTQGEDMMQDSLPRAHTCFNQLVIPTYSSLIVMQEKLKFAIMETEGFELS